jgi:pimeloyl-ACP methyl ester carboxylesterase
MDIAGFERRDVAANGARLSVQLGGEGPPLLLVHGWMGKGYTWRHVAPLLAARHRVVVPDMRGYGESDKPEGGYDGLSLVEDLRALCAALGVERPLVVGHDMGALPALLWAATRPEEVAGLSYLDEPLPGFNLEGYTTFGPPIGGFWWFGFNWTPGLAELLMEGREREFVGFLMPKMVANPAALTDADLDEYARTLRGRAAIAGSLGWYRAVLETSAQIREALSGGLKVSVLALGGEYGIAGTHDQFRDHAPMLEGGVIAGCGHLIPEEKPEELAARLLAFAAKAEPGE